MRVWGHGTRVATITGTQEQLASLVDHHPHGIRSDPVGPEDEATTAAVALGEARGPGEALACIGRDIANSPPQVFLERARRRCPLKGLGRHPCVDPRSLTGTLPANGKPGGAIYASSALIPPTCTSES